MSYLAVRPFEGGDIPTSVPQGGLTKLTTILSNAITLFMIAALILVVIYFIWGGIQWIMSGGEKSKVAAARSKLTWAIIGFIIVLLSFFIVNTLGFFFGVTFLKLT